MILLSENKDYRYYGVPLPLNVNRIDRARTNEGQYYLTFDVPFNTDRTSSYNWVENKFIKVGDKQKIEIIGILGKDSEVSEEILSELGYNALTVDGKIFTHPSEALEYDLKLKGILIENPIEKPKMWNDDGINLESKADKYEKNFNRWQSYEDKLQKVVLIKVKK